MTDPADFGVNNSSTTAYPVLLLTIAAGKITHNEKWKNDIFHFPKKVFFGYQQYKFLPAEIENSSGSKISSARLFDACVDETFFFPWHFSKKNVPALLCTRFPSRVFFVDIC